MRTYLSILKVLIIGYVSIIGVSAQCPVPSSCVNIGTATSCTLAASSTYSSIVSFNSSNVVNNTNTNIVITSGSVKIAGTSQLKPGVQLKAVPCTFVPAIMYYKFVSVSCGATTGSSEGQTAGTQLAIPINCLFTLKAYYRDAAGTETEAWGYGSGYWRYKDGSNTPVNYSSASSTIPICSNNWNVSAGISNSYFATGSTTSWSCLDLNDDQMFYQIGTVQWPVLSFSVQVSGMANFAAAPNSHFRVGVDDVIYDPSVSVYPNPNDGSFTLILPSSEAYEVSISDILGNVILTENVSNIISKNYKLNNLTNGMYIVNVTGNGVQKHTKVQLIK